MKFVVFQENLSKALSTVNNFITSKTQLPILNNILFTLKNGKLKLSATNLEISVNLWIPAKIEEEGVVTLPAKTTTDFISSLPNDKIFLETEKNNLKINCRNYKAVLNGISASEFPSIPTLKNKKKIEEDKTIDLVADTFIRAIKQTSFSAAQDESRPILTGIKMDFNKNLQMAATDGYRLSLNKIEIEEKTKPFNLIIPVKALTELSKIYSPEKDKNIKITLLKNENQVIFSFNNIEIITKLLEGKFPDFEKIIPQGTLIKTVIDKDEFKKAIKTAALFAKNNANIIKLEIEGQKLKIAANAPEVGENKIEMDIKKTGEDTKIAFNCRFLQEYLNNIDEKEIKMELLGKLKPGIFKPLKKDNFLHIIMPVRVQD